MVYKNQIGGIIMNKRIKKKHGYDYIKDEDLWSLDITLAKYILPRLIRFKETNINSYPPDFKSVDEWHNVIDKMIKAFEIVVKDDWRYVGHEEAEKKNKEYQDGINLFAEYFTELWD